MKTIFKFSAVVAFIFTLFLIGCSGNIANQHTDYLTEVPDGLIDELNRKFDERVESIKSAESEWTVAPEGTVWYFSQSEGENINDGKSPDTPMKTLSKLQRMLDSGNIKSGDVVLFKRGDEWRGRLTVSAKGVTLSAYGEGDKPRIIASNEADKPEQWKETDVEGVYVYSASLIASLDVGQIVFNDGEAYGLKIVVDPNTKAILHAGDNNLVGNGIKTWTHRTGAYDGYESLAKYASEIPDADLFYYHDLRTEKVYLYSREGNPGDRFDSIEMVTRGHGITVHANNVILDNLCIKYAGSHGISASSSKNFTVRNCEIGWIGGSIQSSGTTRFGNAIEIYGAADGYYVYNNYMYQCFDCGPTVQWSGTLDEGQKMIEKNIEFYGNALKEASLEVWLTSSDPATDTTYALLENCRMYDNYVTGSGTGWKAYNHQKHEWCSFYGGPQSNAIYKDCYMENNYFWNNRRHLMKAVPTTTKDNLGFKWINNTIIHPLDEGSIGYMGGDAANARGGSVQYFYEKDTVNALVNSGALGVNKFYYIPGDISNRRVADSMYS